MARIRSDKPESYQSETLAEVSVHAERTFRGMATIADDRGRLADKPAQINGELWSMRSEREPHTRDDLEAELQEMVKVDLICRYVGCDGKRYIHPVKWDAHQKIDRPSKSRLPRCPHHQLDPDYCGLHDGDCPTRAGSRDSAEPSMQTREDSRGLDADSRAIGEGSMQDLGPRIVDLGSRTVEPRAHAREVAPGVLGSQLLQEHTNQCRPKPPRDVTRRTGEQIDKLLDDPEVTPDEIRGALALLRSKPGVGPGLLPDLVNEVRQRKAGNGQPQRASPPRGHQPYRNPPESAYDTRFSDAQ